MDKKPPKIKEVVVDELRLDLYNPRFAGGPFENEEKMIERMLEDADLQEMLLSIVNSGYLDFEPIVVEDGNLTVLEGNRRVAALKLLKDDSLSQRLKVSLPSPSNPDPPAMPTKIKAAFVENRGAARNFIGFKHVNGPQKWDAMAKAKFATDWHREGASLDEISRSLGDTFNTVRRLVDGYRVYQQAKDEGFNPERRTARRFAFSHLYTAITRRSIRAWLDLNPDSKDGPVPKDKLGHLLQLMSWLYGQGDDEPAVIRSQNPDLNRLAGVMDHDRCREIFIATRDLEHAWKELEPPGARLEHTLIQAVRETETANTLASSFDGRENVYAFSERLLRNANWLFKTFRDYRDREAGLQDEPDGQ